MELEIGSVMAGKVTGITKFGAFVSVAPGQSGLVHISEIANTYVSEVSDHLTVGQEVQVKVIGLDGGKINLSIKATLPPAPRQAREGGGQRTFAPRRSTGGQGAPAPGVAVAEAARQPEDFEDRLQRFMKDSDNKMSGIRQFNDKKGGRRRK
ncbi:MAG: S1 RNA-binding domain-containing protein [Oscillospiraceae bacterium]|jgi:S1 RNA binding domain protein|nr:S1 RNA-binding domain-containing protein [Oscillospiraceae bacterium]